ncbi:unnamed protein product, partial [Hapterophycus canaliculatus]
LAAGDDYDAFEQSGGIDFLQFFLEMVDELGEEIGETSQTIYMSSQAETAPAAESAEVKAPAQAVEGETATPEIKAEPAVAAEPTPEPAAAPAEAAQDEDRISPRRVRAQSTGARSARPRSKRMTIDMSDETQIEAPQRSTTRGLRAVFQEDEAAAK